MPIVSPNGRYLLYFDEFKGVVKGHIVEIVKPKKNKDEKHVFSL